MNTIKLTLELQYNSRTFAGLGAINPDHFTEEYKYSIEPWGSYHEKIVVTLDGLDLGLFDAEGDAYLADFLNVVPGDIISWEVVEVV